MENKSKTIQSGVGVAIILVGLFLPQIKENVPSIISPGPSVREALAITEPTELGRAKGLALDGIVTDDKDKAQLSVFTFEFKERVPSYEGNSEQVTAVVRDAAEETFGKTLKPKYNGQIGTLLRADLDEIHGGKFVPLTDKNKAKLAEVYHGYSYVLGGENVKE